MEFQKEIFEDEDFAKVSTIGEITQVKLNKLILGPMCSARGVP